MNRFICESLAGEHRVAAALDGEEGLAKAIALAPDLILTDFMMPGMSGGDLLRAVRAHPAIGTTPVVVLTAKADDEVRVRLLREGAADYLTKPFSVEELRARVGNIVARRSAERESRRLDEQIRGVSRASEAVTEAIAGLPASSVAAVLTTIAVQARMLTGADYAAVGIGTDPGRPFDPWVHVGLPDEVVAAIGRHPRPVGTFGVVAREGRTVRVRDVRRDPAYAGVPPHHPEMSSFLGVPIRFRGKSVGNIYLANKLGAEELARSASGSRERGAPAEAERSREFDERDQHVVEMLADRAGVAIAIAGLYQAQGMERAWLEAVIDQMPEGVVLLDTDGRIRAQNRAALALSADEPIGRDPFGYPLLFDLRRPSGERVPLDEYPRVRVLLKGESSAGEEFLMHAAGGRIVPVFLSASPVRGPGGETSGAMIVVQDITALKELERLREEWTSLVAHDLRQPVAAIALLADQLARTKDLPEAAAKPIGRIRVNSEKLNRMIEDLLDASRIESRRLAIEPADVSPQALVRTAIVAVPEIAGRCEVRLEGKSDGVVRADAGRIEQVLVNLLTNAAKYGDPGAPIEIAVRGGDDEVEVTVTNHGPGIPPDELPQLFGRFRRSREARAGSVPGIGLGLYICKGIVESHGGRIGAESVPGGRTSFQFTLPRAGRTTDRRADSSPARPAEAKRPCDARDGPERRRAPGSSAR
jgi:PAS domain S-box-containing protein